MTIASAIIWIIGFSLSVILGPTLNIWTWGPTMLCFSVATALTLPGIWRDHLVRLNPFILLSGLLTVTWFAGRAWLSPAKELALLDLSLVAMATSSFIVFHHIFHNKTAQAIIISGIALLLAADLVVLAAQIRNIDYYFLMPHSERIWPSGFFRHYSHGAAFLIGTSLLLAGFSLKSSWPTFCRIALFLLAGLGLAAVVATKSRSGMLGAGGGVLALTLYWIFTTKRDDRKWVGATLVLAPFFLLGITIISLSLLDSVQQTRHEGSNLVDMLDNDIRLYLYGIALSCTGLHPFIGGGSRSFSWECYQFWKPDDFGWLSSDPQHVHNEFAQVFTDYGIIGAFLLTLFIIGIWVTCTFYSLNKGEWSRHPHSDAWRIGGISAFIGIFIQSNFEGILRTAPGAILLGVCLAAASHVHVHHAFGSATRFAFRRIHLTTISILMIGVMGLYGWKGSMIIRTLWPVTFEKNAVPSENKIQAYSEALEIWKLESLYTERGIHYSQLAFEDPEGSEFRNLLNLALKDYQAASLLHPYTPLHPRNAAGVSSALGQTESAGELYQKAIRLQGGMEAAYKARFQYAIHLHRTGVMALETKQFAESIRSFEAAKSQLEMTPAYIHGAPFYELQTTIHINLAIALENHGEYERALALYDAANANHHAAVMLTGLGVKIWGKRRPADAMRIFLEAETRLKKSAALHPGVTKNDRDGLMEYLQSRIQLLQRTRYEPSENLVFE
jgi:tetratricopeptide (TPR) repeat protein